VTLMALHLASPDELTDHVGESLGTTSWIEITQERIDRFADATGDHQWIHTDPERASQGPFGTTIAHGYLTLSLAAVFLGELLTVDGVAMAVNYGLNKARFPAPVKVGSKVRASGQLRAAEDRGRLVEATIALSYEVEGGDRPPCVAEAVVLFQRP
jgi:acyl dehydratase